MALAMSFVNEVLRQFDTTVLVDQKDWASMMGMFKFEPDRPLCILDRMTLKGVVGGYDGFQAQLSKLVAERDQLQAKIRELEAVVAQKPAETTEKAPVSA